MLLLNNSLLLAFIIIFFASFSYFGCSGSNNDENFEEKMRIKRKKMVELLTYYGIKDDKILNAMLKIRRHVYIPKEYLFLSDPYGDHPCPIGYEQTISQPFIVAYMTEKINPKPGEKILEIGTGSGYQAALLAELGAEVYSIEIIPELASHAIQVLASEGYNVKVLNGDGYKGWPEYAPFDAIIVTCAPEEIPKELINQLRDGGRMILPLGERFAQRLVILRKEGNNIKLEEDLPVRFVPMIKGREKE